MFGQHKAPFNLQGDGITISVEQKEDTMIYQRNCLDKKVEMLLLTTNGKILINPIEPLQTPKEVTPYLIVEFDRKVLVEPKASKKIYITFPIEIGVFVFGKKEYEILDIVSLARQKFTLYGDPTNGEICKDWCSDVYTSIPNTDPYHEGVVELTIKNELDKWFKVTKAVFNAYGMKIYYNNEKVSMRATMKITTKTTAETDFVDSPLEKNMLKSLELYTIKKIPIMSKKFVMREGL